MGWRMVGTALLASPLGRPLTPSGAGAWFPQNEGLHQFEEQPVENLFPELTNLTSR